MTSEERWASMSVLDTELEYFEQHRVEWCEVHTGQFSLIKGIVLRGFYDTYEGALEDAYNTFGNVSFLIKEVQLEDEVIFVPYYVSNRPFQGHTG